MSEAEKRYREFYADLRGAFLAAGPPTYSELVTIMRSRQEENPHRRALGSSALQAMMNGQSKQLPRWSVLSAVIEALRVHARKTGLNQEKVGTVQQWHQRLLQAMDAASGAKTGPD